MYLLFRISIKYLQENNYIRNILNSKSNCFHYLSHKNVVFLKNIYVIIISEDTDPECAKLHHLKKYFSPEHVALAMCSKTRRPHIFSKNDTPMFKYGFTPLP